MRTVFMGTPGFALPVLEAVRELGYAVVGVYTQPDRPAGRGRRLVAPPVKVFAERMGLPVLQPSTLRHPSVIGELAALTPDLIVVAAYGRIIPWEVLSLCPQGCPNVHPSLLPRHRGPSPVATAILEGDAVTGVSLFLMDAGMDTGPVLAQREEAIHPSDTTAVLTERLFRLGAALLKETLPQWLAGKLTPRPQDDSRATTTRMLKKEDGRLDWRRTAEELERQVRAYTPWPGSFTSWQGGLFKVLLAQPLPGGPDQQPGLVVATERADAPLGVATAEGILALARVQLEGRKPVSAGEFLRGHPHIVGAVLGG